MNQEKLSEVLKLHMKWLYGKDDGVRADLRDVDLSRVDLSNSDLRYVDLSGAYLINANLSHADLSHADLSGVYLMDADLSHADLSGANLACADLRGANLSHVLTNEHTAFFHLQCPDKGSYIGYKKCKGNKIVELLITDDAKRSSATSRKCRANKAKVLSITNIDASKNYGHAASVYDYKFIYKVGEIVEVDNFDEDRWNECSAGIHHFLTREEAVNY